MQATRVLEVALIVARTASLVPVFERAQCIRREVDTFSDHTTEHPTSKQLAEIVKQATQLVKLSHLFTPGQCVQVVSMNREGTFRLIGAEGPRAGQALVNMGGALEIWTTLDNLAAIEQDGARPARVENLKEGEYVKRLADAKKVYQRGKYIRSERKYLLIDTDDTNCSVYVKKGTKLFVGFTY